MDIILGGVGAYLDISGTREFPTWVWIVLLVAGLAIAPFFSFHRMRIRLQNVTEDRAKELHRLILQVCHEAGWVVSLHFLGDDFKDKLDEVSTKYLDTLKSLDIEAGIDGGEVKESIQKFTNYVAFHVTRFIAWDGQVISDGDTKQKLEIEKYQFIGRMAGRADETIQRIREVFKQ